MPAGVDQPWLPRHQDPATRREALRFGPRNARWGRNGAGPTVEIRRRLAFSGKGCEAGCRAQPRLHNGQRDLLVEGGRAEAKAVLVSALYEHQVRERCSLNSSRKTPARRAGDVGEGLARATSGPGRGRRTGRTASTPLATISRCWPVKHHPGPPGRQPPESHRSLAPV